MGPMPEKQKKSGQRFAIRIPVYSLLIVHTCVYYCPRETLNLLEHRVAVSTYVTDLLNCYSHSLRAQLPSLPSDTPSAGCGTGHGHIILRHFLHQLQIIGNFFILSDRVRNVSAPSFSLHSPQHDVTGRRECITGSIKPHFFSLSIGFIRVGDTISYNRICLTETQARFHRKEQRFRQWKD